MTGTILTPGSRVGAETMEKAARGRSLWDDARRRLLRNKAAVGGMIVLGPVSYTHLTLPTNREV